MSGTVETQDELNRLLRYEPETGLLFWRHRPREAFTSVGQFKVWNKRFADKPALSSKSWAGYLTGTLGGRRVRAQRVIWKMMHGVEPALIDHINGDRSDNRAANLRLVDHITNCKNQRRHVDNITGHAGVSWSATRRRWHARIGVAGQDRHLGYFTKKVDAIAARQSALAEHGFHPNHGSAAK